MVALNETITIVNKGGKIVGTSKQLVNVFNEARSAYNERKAELRAQRKGEQEVKSREREARRQLEALALQENYVRNSRLGSKPGSDSGRTAERKPVPSRTETRSVVQQGKSSSSCANDPRCHASHRPSPLQCEVGDDDVPRIGELTRRHTDGMQLRSTKPVGRRMASLDGIDMDLAYGDPPPPLRETTFEDDLELRSKMEHLQHLLDEGNCLQHSVTAIINNLQKNPDALAAVALTLAEISNIAAKMAPGALAAMKTSFPAIVALLASPQFMIAAGVGVGVTIIALGGYKIIKKIKARDEQRLLEDGFVVAEPETQPDEMDQLRELDHIEKWRRGIADVEANSKGTSLDGELITPFATRTLIQEGRLTEADFKPLEPKGGKKPRKKKTKSEASSSSRKSRSGEKVRMKKEPSVLRSLFKGHS